MMKTHYGPWALIAGGSEGVGESFARQLAAEGINLVLVARKTGPLETLALSIRQQNGVSVRTVSADLTALDVLDQLRAVTDDLEVGLLIYNAGAVSGFSAFLDQSAEANLKISRLNAITPTILAHHYGGQMRSRGRGGIILVGSMAGYAGGPGEICYSAGKAYSRILSEGLWYELKPHGVHVLGLTLGLTRYAGDGSVGAGDG